MDEKELKELELELATRKLEAKRNRKAAEIKAQLREFDKPKPIFNINEEKTREKAKKWAIIIVIAIVGIVILRKLLIKFGVF